MKLKVSELRRLIRENYAREIPQHAIEDICKKSLKLSPKRAAEFCGEKLEYYFKLHINSTSTSQADLRYKITKMHNVLSDMKEEIKDLEKVDEEKIQEIVSRHVVMFLHA